MADKFSYPEIFGDFRRLISFLNSHFSKFYPNFCDYVAELNGMLKECKEEYKRGTKYTKNTISKSLGKKIKVKLPDRFYDIFEECKTILQQIQRTYVNGVDISTNVELLPGQSGYTYEWEIHTDFSSEGGFGAMLYGRKVRIAYVEICGMKMRKVYQADRSHPQSEFDTVLSDA